MLLRTRPLKPCAAYESQIAAGVSSDRLNVCHTHLHCSFDLFDRRGKHVADAYITATCSHMAYSATSFNALMTIEVRARHQ